MLTFGRKMGFDDLEVINSFEYFNWQAFIVSIFKVVLLDF